MRMTVMSVRSLCAAGTMLSRAVWATAASLTLALTLAARVASAQGYTPSADNLASRERFQNDKFGLFIHWGVYSVLQDGEWVMNDKRLRITEYETLPALFNPVKFDAAAWVRLAKAAGMKYITITSKHHDGFAMWDSKVSDWNIVKRTPWAKDPLAQLAAECAKQGVTLFFYHSQLDWHNADYFPRGGTGRTAGRSEQGDFTKYLDYMNAQLKELLTGYGKIGGIWFDGEWDKPNADWGLDKTYKLIHDLQPGALVISNHHKLPHPGEDVQTFEKDLPGANTAGFNTKEIGALPLETAQTMNDSWGFRLTDRHFRSSTSLIRELVNAAGRNANFLLNVGPRPDGTIQQDFADTLMKVGAWMQRYGASVYGTRGGPFTPRPWGVTTQRGDSVFVHVLDWSDATLALPAVPRKVMAASLLGDARAVVFRQDSQAVTLTLPVRAADELDQVVVLRLAPGR
jgi:alpha-L-fucosidase